MRKWTTAACFLIALLMPLAPICASAFEENFRNTLYDEAYPLDKKDYTLVIAVEGENTGIEVHSSAFSNVESLKLLFADEKSPTIRLENEAQASAFKKVIYFLYKNQKPDAVRSDPRFKDFFEPFDLPELAIAAWQHGVKALSHTIALFLHEQVERKFNDPSSSTLLDQLAPERFEFLYSIFIGMDEKTYKSDPQLKTIRSDLNYYAHLLCLVHDRKNDKIEFDPNICIQIGEQQKVLRATALQQKKVREREDKARKFEDAAQKIAQKIFGEFRQDLRKKKAYFSPHHYSVPKRYTDRVISILGTQLPNFTITLDPDIGDYNPDWNLAHRCSKPCTPGTCIAQGAGWIGWMLLYPIQVLTCDFGIGCKILQSNESLTCCCPSSKYDYGCTILYGSQSGEAIFHGLYNTATLYHRWIRIEPKKIDEIGLRLPPVPAFVEETGKAKSVIKL